MGGLDITNPGSGENGTGFDFAQLRQLFNLGHEVLRSRCGWGPGYTDPGLGGVKIFVDVNKDGHFEVGEYSAITAADGSWSISGLGTDALDKTYWR